MSNFNVASFPAGANQAWAGVYGNGTFVVVEFGIGYVCTSPDGVNWTRRMLYAGTTAWAAIAFGNGKFVALAHQTSGTNAVATSVDGVTWALGSLPATSLWQAVAFGNGTFVAMGDYPGAGGVRCAATSTDGITWVQQTVPAFFDVSPTNSLAFGNGVFVAMASSALAISPDGVSWTQYTPSGPLGGNLFFAGGLFVSAPFSTTTVYTSPDGVTWTARTLPTTSGGWNLVTGSSSFLLALSYNTTDAATSTDGVTWSPLTAPIAEPWQSAASAGNTMVAFGNFLSVLVYGAVPPPFWTNYQRCFETDS